MRYDVSFYQERFDYSSQIYPTYELGDILYINPSVTFSELRDNDVISYVPMEAIDEKYLNDTQIKYLHEYQKTVYEKISPYLNEEEKEWLAAETGVK